MRARLLFIVAAILVVAGFAALNWPEFTRSTPLNFGILSTTLPVGMVMLTLLGIILAAFLISSATQESRHLLEHRRHTRALQAQRDLAEKAEASRFTDLRQHLDTHLTETRQRTTIAATEFEKAVLQSQRELRAQLEQMNHALLARIGELEARIPGPRGERVEHVERVEVVDPKPAAPDAPPRDRVRL
jgi:uncharacterized protein YaiL (DUF2058 family)